MSRFAIRQVFPSVSYLRAGKNHTKKVAKLKNTKKESELETLEKVTTDKSESNVVIPSKRKFEDVHISHFRIWSWRGNVNTFYWYV